MIKVTAYIPVAKLPTYSIGEIIRTLTIVAGGATHTQAHGDWQAPDGQMVSEPITLVSWLVPDGAAPGKAFSANLNRFVAELHASGEQSVLVEKTHNVAVEYHERETA